MKKYNLIFDQYSIKIDANIPGYEVMMEWERPLMKKHADIVCQFGGDILELGFGMGISANYIQSNNIKSHTIVELHPQVIERLIQWSGDKPNVRIIEGDWFEKIEEICLMEYDGIFFDTHLDTNFRFLKKLIDKCLKSGGIFSWYSPEGTPINGVSNFLTESVNVNPPVNCSYYNSNTALAPYYIKP